MKNLLSFIKSLIKESDLQILLVTHSAELFSQISDLNYQTYKEDGIGKMRAVDREDILEMQDIDVNDTTVEIP
jgi:ABC-type molybdate transport system ATPase subunit